MLYIIVLYKSTFISLLTDLRCPYDHAVSDLPPSVKQR